MSKKGKKKEMIQNKEGKQGRMDRKKDRKVRGKDR